MLLERILTDLDADVFHPFLLLRKELPSGLVRNSKPVSLFQKNLLTIDRCMSTTIENERDLLVFLFETMFLTFSIRRNLGKVPSSFAR